MRRSGRLLYRNTLRHGQSRHDAITRDSGQELYADSTANDEREREYQYADSTSQHQIAPLQDPAQGFPVAKASLRMLLWFGGLITAAATALAAFWKYLAGG